LARKRTPERASEKEDKKLNDYELVVIISQEADEEKSEAAIESINQFIATQGGVVANIDRWGRRKLAYPIEHFAEGNYVLMHINLKPAVTRELEANLRISETVLRYLLIRND
jgi:small subunit ribosomal protein S6